jgi:hypothetical protein
MEKAVGVTVSHADVANDFTLRPLNCRESDAANRRTVTATLERPEDKNTRQRPSRSPRGLRPMFYFSSDWGLHSPGIRANPRATAAPKVLVAAQTRQDIAARAPTLVTGEF